MTSKPRTLATLLGTGLLATVLAACGGGDDLTESEACDQFNAIILEAQSSAPSDSSDMSALPETMESMGQFAGDLQDLADRSPENLAPLFQSQADLFEAAGNQDMDALMNAEDNSAEIIEICGVPGQ